MKLLKSGSVIDSECYVISEQERELISVVFSYFKDILPEIIGNFGKEESQ